MKRLSLFLQGILLSAMTLWPPATRSNELIFATAKEARQQGYVPPSTTATLLVSSPPSLPEPHSLPWPIRFENAEHSMGNIMVQYQNYEGSAYLHGGCDLRAHRGEEINAPFGGRLEAGHYGYVVNEDGSLTKHSKAWPLPGEPLYFEVSITQPSGLRLEIHHIDRNSLPKNIVAQLNQSGFAEVAAKDFLGRVATWPVRGADGSYYHHIHYNLIHPQGHALNPEYYSPLVQDTQAPEISGIWALAGDDSVEEVHPGQPLKTRPQQIVVGTQDFSEPNVYIHPPTLARLKSHEEVLFAWDFRKTLLSPEGTFPNVHRVFRELLTLPDGQNRTTEGNYEKNDFMIALYPPPTAPDGLWTVELEDAAGNRSERSFEVPFHHLPYR